MTNKKIDVDEMIDDVLKVKKKRPKNFIDRLDADGKEFMFKLKGKYKEGAVISPAAIIEKLKELIIKQLRPNKKKNQKKKNRKSLLERKERFAWFLRADIFSVLPYLYFCSIG